MFRFNSNYFWPFVLWIVFIFVVYEVPYPETITQANIIQLTNFFVPLFLAISFTLNTFLKNIFISVSVSLGVIFSLFLKSLDSLNIVTGILVLISIGLLISYFKKGKKRSLTNIHKIHKLTKLGRKI